MIKISVLAMSLLGMSYLSISDATTGKSYKVSSPTAFDLANKQNHTLSIKAKLIKRAVGPGFPAVIEVAQVNN